MCWAYWPIGAIAADKTGLRGEFAGANVRRGFLNNFLCFVQLFRVAGSHLGLVILQIMEDQTYRVPFENFFCRKGIKTELQISFRVRFLFWFARFVIDDLTVFPAEGFPLVHPPAVLPIFSHRTSDALPFSPPF